MKKYKLSEICDFNAYTINRKEAPQNILYLDTSSLTDNEVSSLQELEYESAPSRAQRIVKKNTILYSSVRPNQRHFGVFHEPQENLIASTGFVSINLKDENEFSIDYLYLLLTQSYIVDYLQTIAENSVSAYPSINPSDIGNLSFDFPPLSEQKKIAAVLSSFDRQIALCRSQNETLEQMAKQLYDYWFVQFDFPGADGKPYKSSGGKMVYNAQLKREIPEGWECGTIGQFMRIFTGKKDVSKAIPGQYKFFSCAPEPITSNEYLYDGDVLLVSGNGSYTGRVSFYKGKFDLYQRTYACVLDENPKNIVFFYMTLKELFQPAYSGGRHGSSIPYIVLSDLADFSFAFNKEIVERYVEAMNSAYYKILENNQQISSLTRQRDELLPLLMNGQVEVK